MAIMWLVVRHADRRRVSLLVLHERGLVLTFQAGDTRLYLRSEVSGIDSAHGEIATQLNFTTAQSLTLDWQGPEHEQRLIQRINQWLS